MSRPASPPFLPLLSSFVTLLAAVTITANLIATPRPLLGHPRAAASTAPAQCPAGYSCTNCSSGFSCASGYISSCTNVPGACAKFFDCCCTCVPQ